jgi:hypothetical protein
MSGTSDKITHFGGNTDSLNFCVLLLLSMVWQRSQRVGDANPRAGTITLFLYDCEHELAMK